MVGDSNPQFNGPSATSLDDPMQAAAMKALIGIVMLEPIILVVILAVVGVDWWVYVIVLGGGILVPAAVIWLIVQTAWNPRANRYPAQPIGPDAVSKSWQSFAFGWFTRFNNCLTIVADERHIHLVPVPFMRWFGARVISLPLDRMTDLKPAVGGMMSAQLDGKRITGPKWCMRLAQPEADTDTLAK